MRRVIFILSFLVIAGFGAWWAFFRVTPERALAIAFGKLGNAGTVQSARANVYWDVKDRSGQGFVLDKWLSFNGSLDLEDPSRIRGAGVIWYGVTANPDDFQSADAVLTGDRAAFRLRDADEEIERWFAEHSGTSTKDQWFDFDRDTLLKSKGLSSWVAGGSGSGVRRAFEGADPAAMAVLSGVPRLYERDGRRLMEVKIDASAAEDQIERALIALTAAWFGRDPTDRQIDWARLAAQGAALGTWYVTVDLDSGEFRKIQGSWPFLDDAGEIAGHAVAEIEFSGFGWDVAISAPDQAIDLTPALGADAPGTFAPAGERALPVPDAVEELEPASDGT
jgi:hypothetical protein